MEFTSYILSFITTILGLCEPFFKKMKVILTFNFFGNLLPAISYLLVGVYNGAAICFFACIQTFVNYIIGLKNKKVPKWLIGVYAVCFLAINMTAYQAWYDIFALIASMLFVLSVAQSNPKYYRALYVSNSCTWILYDFLAKAYGNLFTHIVLFVATSAAIIWRDIKSTKKVVEE